MSDNVISMDQARDALERAKRRRDRLARERREHNERVLENWRNQRG